jgi:hypothetical protein
LEKVCTSIGAKWSPTPGGPPPKLGRTPPDAREAPDGDSRRGSGRRAAEDGSGTLRGGGWRVAGTWKVILSSPMTLPLAMQIRFAVRNPAGLEELIANQQDPAAPNYRKWLRTGGGSEVFA